MGLIVLEGVAITILVLTGFREAIFKAIPLELKKAIVVGIGFFILFIGLVDGGLVVGGGGTPVSLGTFVGVPVLRSPSSASSITIIMLARSWRGADHPRHHLLHDLRDRSSTTPTTRRRSRQGTAVVPEQDRRDARLQPASAPSTSAPSASSA